MVLNMLLKIGCPAQDPKGSTGEAIKAFKAKSFYRLFKL